MILKACVPVFVITYYMVLEKYNRSDLQTDNFIIYFVELVVFWHFYSRIMRSAFETSRKQYCSIGVFIVLLVLLLIGKIVWYFTAGVNIDRTIYWRRLIFEWVYIVMQIVNGTNLGEMSQDFWYFLADCLMGMQIFTIYFRDEFNYSAFNSFTPILLSLLTFLLIKGLLVNHYNKDTP